MAFQSPFLLLPHEHALTFRSTCILEQQDTHRKLPLTVCLRSFLVFLFFFYKSKLDDHSWHRVLGLGSVQEWQCASGETIYCFISCSVTKWMATLAASGTPHNIPTRNKRCTTCFKCLPIGTQNAVLCRLLMWQSKRGWCYECQEMELSCFFFIFKAFN